MRHPEKPNPEKQLEESRRKFHQAHEELRQALNEASHAFLGDPNDETIPPEILYKPPKPFKE
jgi:hypothetical protein